MTEISVVDLLIAWPALFCSSICDITHWLTFQYVYQNKVGLVVIKNLFLGAV